MWVRLKLRDSNHYLLKELTTEGWSVFPKFIVTLNLTRMYTKLGLFESDERE